MSYLEKLATYNKIIWDDFSVKNEELYSVEKDIDSLTATEEATMIALNFSRYNGFNLQGYGEGTATRGITEQEAYDIWSGVFGEEQFKFKRQISKLEISKIPQSVYDGLMLYFWASGKLLFVEAAEGVYSIRNYIIQKDWDTVASMIARSKISKSHCIRAASVLRLADYSKIKNRSWFRTQGIFKMRDLNDSGQLSESELRRARFAYYAETLKFLPFTPDSVKRDIVKQYEKTLSTKTFIADGTNNLYVLEKNPSMTPVEKLSVFVNDILIQTEFDYIISGNVLTVSKELKQGDIIKTIIKI
jgi:hypothetical protein